MATPFSKIISGEIPAYKVAESEMFLAFLDIQPVAIGHTLVIPKVEVDYIFDLDDQTLAAMHLFAREIAQKIKRIVPCQKIGMAVIGLEVAHAHIHLVPINNVGDMSFTNERMKMTVVEFQALAERIKSA